MEKVIFVIDSFKGCLSSAEANAAAARGLLSAHPNCGVECVTVSDGGEGWLDAFDAALDCRRVEVPCHDPMMRRIVAPYLIYGNTAIIEIARASGLTLLAPEERNPMRATSYGTGELVADALKRGCKKLIVGLGGSATSDAGIGMLRAVVDNLAPKGQWDDIRQIIDVECVVACDVTNPLYGPDGAAAVFGPQKGATPEMVDALDNRAVRFAEFSARHFGRDMSDKPGAGAAGGLGYAFMQYFNARQMPGIQLLLDTIGFDKLLCGADLVVTGEGSADRQTLMGKLPTGIMRRASAQGVPTLLLAGKVEDAALLEREGFAKVLCINPPGLPLSEAMRKEVAAANISHIMADVEV